jgi:hypothetical protein
VLSSSYYLAPHGQVTHIGARFIVAHPTRRAISAFTDVFLALACASRRFHVETGRRTLRTAVGLLRGRPLRTNLPTTLDGISHRDQSAMPSAGS